MCWKNINYKSYHYNLIICLVMKSSPGQIKIEPDDDFGIREPIFDGPLRVEHGLAEKKPIYVPQVASWTNFQNAKYAAYILQNRTKMEGRSPACLWGLFKDMGQFVGSRNFRQCKLHHQRLCAIEPIISGIVDRLRSSIDDFDTLLSMEMKSYKNFMSSKEKSAASQEASSSHSLSLIEPKKPPSKETLVDTDEKYPQDPKEPPKAESPVVPPQKVLASIFPMLMPVAQSRKNADEWLYCHSLFLEWTRRVKELNEISISY